MKFKPNEGNYFVRVGCSNCGLRKKIEIRKGVTVTDFPCPNCGVKFLETIESNDAVFIRSMRRLSRD